jgi:hypothetical protein
LNRGRLEVPPSRGTNPSSPLGPRLTFRATTTKSDAPGLLRGCPGLETRFPTRACGYLEEVARIPASREPSYLTKDEDDLRNRGAPSCLHVRRHAGDSVIGSQRSRLIRMTAAERQRYVDWWTKHSGLTPRQLRQIATAIWTDRLLDEGAEPVPARPRSHRSASAQAERGGRQGLRQAP